MNEGEFYKVLTEIFCEVFQRSDILIKDSLWPDDLDEYDSLMRLDIIIAAEQRLGIKLSSHEVDRTDSVFNLITILSDHCRRT